MGINLHRRVLLVIVLTLSACAVPIGPSAVARLSDLDKDGVSDGKDQCENTVQPQPVDEQGCPVFQGALPGVDFSANSADLDPAARVSLDELVSLLKTHPSVVVSVDGHTDNRGSGIRNLALSKQRVLAVVRYLVARGVNPKRLRPYGYGESRPVVSNGSASGRLQNRRIEVSVILPSQVPLQPPLQAPLQAPEDSDRTEQAAAAPISEI